MEQTVTFDNFCMIMDNFHTKEQCDVLINLFEVYDQMNISWDRKYQESNAHKIADRALFSQDVIRRYCEDTSQSINMADIGLLSGLNDSFWRVAYPLYASKYSIINDYPQHENKVIKIQKTQVGGEGYHIWHSENSEAKNKRRILAWILYLNDVDEGGETEFLYLSKRVKAKAGRLVIFPAGFTHTHRGNPPLSNTKYIATGWVEMG